MRKSLEKILVSFDEYINVDLEKEIDTISEEIKPIETKKYGFTPTSIYNENKKTYSMTNHQEFDDFITQIVEENPFLKKYQTLLEELAHNSLDHGNSYDPNKILKISVTNGHNGWVISIEDDGKGFNFRETLKKGSFTYEGKGLRNLKEKCQEDTLSFSYQNQGKQVNVYTI